MKVRASIKKRSADCKIVRRKGKLYIVNKKIPALSNARDNTFWALDIRCQQPRQTLKSEIQIWLVLPV